MKFHFLSKTLSVHGYCWWAAASTAKLGLGISAIRRGHAGESTFMPFKAFSVASLFVGVAASAAMASLHSFGLQSVRYSCCYFVFGVKNPSFTMSERSFSREYRMKCICGFLGGFVCLSVID
ncbi:hypothetical protein PHJA_000242900 [Phtheirospermum japonicum]|uniref:Uncharacterized protein n=1 Tax=Phtheirospermum japonicum TaxID=374723 RepID=A0A830B2N1_9LAMI|nr:hypothetical protein PHJA_000242900 [Phtheirospermum japonicum]